MKTSATILEDSISPDTGIRLVTMACTYPRYIHSEFMTHRVFSRNASSSRAIPIAKQIAMVEAHPVMPLEWGSNKPGMQAGDQLDTIHRTQAQNLWLLAMREAVRKAKALQELNVHKQLVNRLLEPFAWITVIVTATEWDNFFALRISELAQPEICDLAKKMLSAMTESTPTLRGIHDYHLPYVTSLERESLNPQIAMMVSAARCARVSYLNHDGILPDINKDVALAERLLNDKHASVFEHQARAFKDFEASRNFNGWEQHREMLGL